MKRSKFSDEQILAIVKEGEAGRKVADLCRAKLYRRCDAAGSSLANNLAIWDLPGFVWAAGMTREKPIAAVKPSPHRLLRLWTAAAVTGLLTLLLVQLALTSRAKSATYDEQYHIAHGLAYLRTGDPGLIPEHPPFIDTLAALPLLFDDTIILPSSAPSSGVLGSLGYSDQLLWRLNRDGPTMITRARFATMAITLLLAGVVFAWGCELYGWRSGLLAMLLLTFDPNIVAHGSLATNDIGVACFVTIAVYLFWRMLRRPGVGRAAIAGIVLGLAEVSKFSALALVPIMIGIVLTEYRRIRGLVGYFVIVLVLALLTVWAVYGFDVGTLKQVPFPGRRYVAGLQVFFSMIANGKESFLLGSYSQRGWWYFFPVAFAVKTPIPTMLLVVCAMIVTYLRTWRQSLILLIPIAVFSLSCIVSPFAIGYRHLLPVLPFLFLFAGQVANARWKENRQFSVMLGSAVIWLILGNVSIYPDYLAYFNETVGGPARGYHILVDSNLDWGQDLVGLRQYLSKQNIDSVKLGYTGTAEPRAYGIAYDPLPSLPYHPWRDDTVPDALLHPSPGTYAISATALQGLGFKNHNLYKAFRERRPDAVIGYSIFIYHVR